MRLCNKTTRHLILLAGGVIILLVLSCFFGLALKQEKMIKHSVHLSAERLFESIVLTRRWNAEFGGVFVLKKEGMQSNPYLEHPDIVSASGLTYTLKNPALMTREISELAAESGHYRYHITSLQLMNPKNQPDDWERVSLEQFERGLQESVQIAQIDGQRVYRLMRPLVVETGCMQCHSKQGYVGGEVRGGISVSLPYEEVAQNLSGNRMKMTSLGLAIVVTFSFLFYFVIWRLVTHLFSISGELEEQKRQLEELNAVLDQKVTERTTDLLESEQRFRSTFEQAPVGICHVGLNGRILRVNRLFCEIAGYEESQLLNLHFQDISPEIGELSGVDGWDDLLLGDTETFCLERRYVRGDHSEAWGKLTISLVRKESGAPRYYICVVEDITERRNLARQLQHAQKMEAVGTLAGGIAHDFNNILTPILGYTQMLMEESRPGEKRFSCLQSVFNAAIRAQELIRQILTFSRRNDAEKQPLNIALIIKEVIKLLRSSLPATVTVRQQLTNEPCIVSANPTQIHQIMMNLCTNAFQAMRDCNGVLSIHLATQELGATDIPVATMQPGRYAMLSVSDSGCGMDQQTMERMYEPYFTTKAKGEGTGLGLALVHGIVNDLGGLVVAESTKGKGTTFTIYLPLVEASGLAPSLSLENQEVCGGHERILLVDDEPAIVAMLSAMLCNLGYQVTAFERSPEALRFFQQHPDEFDLVISDITMPEFTGIMLAQEIGTLRADLPVILCTGFSADFSDVILKLHNVTALLTKPILKHDFALAVRKAISGGNQYLADS